MICPNCGCKNSDDASFCMNCGAILEQRLEDPSQVKKTSKKRIIILILVLVIVLAGCGGGYYFFNKHNKVTQSNESDESQDISEDTRDYQDLLEEAKAYRANSEFDLAAKAYLEAIEVEPKILDTYIDLANLYMSTYDYTEAGNILEKARENIGSDNQKLIYKQNELDGLKNGIGRTFFIRSYNGHTYEAWTNFDGVEEAEEFAETIGGHLATITSKEEDEFLYQYFCEIHYDMLYFGLVEGETEGDYSWINGEEFSYENWAYGEPDNAEGGESVGRYWDNYEKTWSDGEPQSYSLYIIEFEE